MASIKSCGLVATIKVPLMYVRKSIRNLKCCVAPAKSLV